MKRFQDGEEARIVKSGVEVEVIVFRQLGEWVYVVDMRNRLYQFHVSDVRRAIRPSAGCRERQGSSAEMEDAAVGTNLNCLGMMQEPAHFLN